MILEPVRVFTVFAPDMPDAAGWLLPRCGMHMRDRLRADRDQATADGAVAEAGEVKGFAA